MFAQLRDEGMKNLSGEERLAFEKSTRWAVRKSEKVGNV
jgi:hypothetical protein